ncbi:MAG: hypothetical protein AB7S81_06370 [Bdellovibrionales bacterium]
MPFAQVSQRLFNTPLAIRPEKAEIVLAALAERLGVARVNGLAVADMEMAAMLITSLCREQAGLVQSV